MPIPVPKKDPRNSNGNGATRSGLPRKRPNRVNPPQRQERVENPYDNQEDENVFTTDLASHAEPYEDLSVPASTARKKQNPFANNNPNNQSRRDNRSSEDEFEDNNAHFEDLEKDNRNASGGNNNADDEYYYDNDYEDEDYDKEKAAAEEAERLEKAKYDYYDVDQDEVEESSKRRNRKQSKKTKPRGNRKDSKGQDVFIDDKEMKLKPFGKRKLKVSELDERKNKQKNAKYIKIVVIAGVIVLIGLGVKNAIIPPDTLNENEVAQISMQTVGITEFPEERGSAFVEDFMNAYLTLGGQQKAADALSFFYTGIVQENFGEPTSGTGTSSAARNVATQGYYGQEIITGPRVYDSYSIDKNSAFYTVGALVQPNTNVSPDERGNLPALEGVNAKWVFFNVNVYYDDVKDTMYISPDSPTLVPSQNVGAQGDVPNPAPIGSGNKADDTIVSQIRPVINGYVEGYANSSTDDYSRVEQYLSTDAEETAKSGLDGQFELAGDVSNAITMTPYTVTGNENELKVLVTVDWLSSINPESSTETLASITYSSNYVATLKKASDGKWEIQNFDSVKYVVGEDGAPVNDETIE